MLKLAVDLFNLVTKFFEFLVNLSYVAGKCLVAIGKWLFVLLATILGNLKILAVVLYEDSGYFWADIRDYVVTFGISVNEVIKSILEWISLGVQKTSEIVSGGFFTIGNIWNGVLGGIGWILVKLKEILLLIGQGGWLLFTVPYRIIWWNVQCMGRAAIDLKNILFSLSSYFTEIAINSALTVWNYFIDVPLHYLLGLGVLYCIYRFRRYWLHEIRTVCTRLETILQQKYALYIVNQQNRQIRVNVNEEVPIFETTTTTTITPARTGPQRRKPLRSAPIKQIVPVAAETLCVVCLDRKKTVLVLPCKHLCMCEPCSLQLEHHHHQTCPLCREKFLRLVPVYT